MGDVAVGDEAFAVLLGAMRDVARATSSVRGASPQQMFEQPIADPRERREAALREDYESSLGTSVAGKRMDATSVQARQASAMEKGAGSIVERNVNQAVSESGGGGTTRSDAPIGREEGSTRIAAPGSEATAGSASRESAAPARSRSIVGDGNGNVPAQAPSQRVAAGAVQAPAVTGAAAAEESGGAARQIGKVLLAARGAQGTSARGVVAAPQMESTGQRGPGQTRADSALPGRQGAAAREAGRSDAAGASEFDRLVRSIRLRSGGRNSSARLRLDPPELGRVQIDVRMDADHVRISVRAETPQAHSLLTERAAELGSALGQHGIQVDRFDVTLDFMGNPAADRMVGGGGGSASSSSWEKPWREARERIGVASGSEAIEFAEEDVGSALAAVGERRLDIRV